MPKSAAIDATDANILAVLQKNVRISNKDLASAVNLAPSTCLERVNRLRRNGTITGERVEVAPAMLGRPLEALLSIRLQAHKRALVDPFVKTVLDRPETRALYHLAGPDDFLVHVAVEDTQTLQDVVLNTYTAREEVLLIHTNLIFQTWPGGPLLPTDSAIS